jgi:benzil reductase ((S)-benzoin forming)
VKQKQLFIITGGSKGLGAGLLHSAFEHGHVTMNIARAPSQEPSEVLFIQHNLKDFSGLPEKISGHLKTMELSQFEVLHLINNAAVIEPVGNISNFESQKIKEHLEINFVTPVLLTSEFLKMTKDFKGWRTVTNISSGAAYRPITAWSLYCATKAGLKMFTENLQLDAESEKIKFISFSPGVMDTQMQSTIRAKTPEEFSDVERFRQLKAKGQLRNPRDVAEALVELLINPKKINKVEYDIAELS